MTNYILVIVAALTGLIVQQKLATTTLPVTVVIVVLGLCGASSAKYHERATYHLMQARALTVTLQELDALPANEHIDAYRQTHYRTYRLLHRIRLHWLWATGRAALPPSVQIDVERVFVPARVGPAASPSAPSQRRRRRRDHKSHCA